MTCDGQAESLTEDGEKVQRLAKIGNCYHPQGERESSKGYQSHSPEVEAH